MTKDELIKKLKALADSKDPEDSHYKADMLLLEYIGDDEVTSAYNDVPGWYA